MVKVWLVQYILAIDIVPREFEEQQQYQEASDDIERCHYQHACFAFPR